MATSPPLVIPPALRSQIADVHGKTIAAALAPLHTDPGLPMPDLGFIFLCFTNRCGSNYLAALLASTGQLNDAGEVFNAETVLVHAAAQHLASLRAYVAHLPRLVPGITDRLVVKAAIDQLMMLTDAGILDDVLPRARFILLERRDRLAQAISRSIAWQTGGWTTAHTARHPNSALRYDSAAITAEIDHVTLETFGFYSFFAANGIVPIHLTYEDLLANPVATVAAIGRALGIPMLQADPAKVGIRRQSNAINAAWRARYIAGG